ncbi:MAG: ATP synthase F1 subunit gamma [Lentisphaeria bacterium]|nr:ATP synthase F1 subunit gamma [Lentisphaeria bacterium]
MASLQEYNKKLRSFKNTLKITKTMKMVSASKLRKAQQNQLGTKAYADKIRELIVRLAGSVDENAHPLLRKNEDAKKALVLVFTSDKGLCGGFNNYAIKYVEKWLAAEGASYDQVDLGCCGRRGFNYFNARYENVKEFEDVTRNPSVAAAKSIADGAMEQFLSGAYDEVFVAYNEFHSPLSQTPTIKKLLPVDPVSNREEAEKAASEEEKADDTEYIFEPSKSDLLEILFPQVVEFSVFSTLLENSAGEHGARMTAMDNATNNSKSLIESYTLLRNRARQAAITTELTEIISGAEAL